MLIVAALAGGSQGAAPALVGAAVAVLVVSAIGLIVHRPLARLPESHLKYAVGLMLTSFGVFFLAEGLTSTGRAGMRRCSTSPRPCCWSRRCTCGGSREALGSWSPGRRGRCRSASRSCSPAACCCGAGLVGPRGRVRAARRRDRGAHAPRCRGGAEGSGCASRRYPGSDVRHRPPRSPRIARLLGDPAAAAAPLALRKRREARVMVTRWQARVRDAERRTYGDGLLGAALMLFVRAAAAGAGALVGPAGGADRARRRCRGGRDVRRGLHARLRRAAVSWLL